MKTTQMMAAIALAATLPLSVTGCDAISAAIGPTCGEFLEASEVEQQAMVLEWMKGQGLADGDAAMTDQGNAGGLLGFEVMANVQRMVNTCRDADSGDRINDYVAY